jgi:hypothetical protein
MPILAVGHSDAAALTLRHSISRIAAGRNIGLDQVIR